MRTGRKEYGEKKRNYVILMGAAPSRMCRRNSRRALAGRSRGRELSTGLVTNDVSPRKRQ